jgi:hypothetical protein
MSALVIIAPIAVNITDGWDRQRAVSERWRAGTEGRGAPYPQLYVIQGGVADPDQERVLRLVQREMKR